VFSSPLPVELLCYLKAHPVHCLGLQLHRSFLESFNELIKKQRKAGKDLATLVNKMAVNNKVQLTKCAARPQHPVHSLSPPAPCCASTQQPGRPQASQSALAPMLHALGHNT
jgi:hypothetical protein